MLDGAVFVNGVPAIERPKGNWGNSGSFDVSKEGFEIFKRGDEIILRKRPRNLAEAFEHIPCMPEDFMADGREQEIQQEREDWT